MLIFRTWSLRPEVRVDIKHTIVKVGSSKQRICRSKTGLHSSMYINCLCGSYTDNSRCRGGRNGDNFIVKFMKWQCHLTQWAGRKCGNWQWQLRNCSSGNWNWYWQVCTCTSGNRSCIW